MSVDEADDGDANGFVCGSLRCSRKSGRRSRRGEARDLFMFPQDRWLVLQADGRSFDVASRDEAAGGFAQDGTYGAGVNLHINLTASQGDFSLSDLHGFRIPFYGLALRRRRRC